jgi:hypothetical protein
MDDSLVVRCGERVGDLARDADRLVEWQDTPFQALAQGLTVDQFEDQ